MCANDSVPARVILVEPTCLLRGALARALGAEAELEVVAALGAYGDVGADLPDAHVVLLGLNPPTAEAVAAAGWLAENAPDRRLLLMTSAANANRARQALDGTGLGRAVRGIVSTDNTPAQLTRYILRAASGARVVDPRLSGTRTAGRNPFTAREREVLRLVATGMPDPEIAAALGLSSGTVRNYLSGILAKTGARNRVEAVHLAEQAGWV
jgi:two-component system response regulator DesR